MPPLPSSWPQMITQKYIIFDESRSKRNQCSFTTFGRFAPFFVVSVFHWYLPTLFNWEISDSNSTSASPYFPPQNQTESCIEKSPKLQVKGEFHRGFAMASVATSTDGEFRLYQVHPSLTLFSPKLSVCFDQNLAEGQADQLVLIEMH